MNITINNEDQVYILRPEAQSRFCKIIMLCPDRELAELGMNDFLTSHYPGIVFQQTNTQQSEMKDEQNGKPPKTNSSYLPAVNPSQVGIIMNHIYKNKVAGVLIKTRRDSSSDSISYYGYDPTGLTPEQKAESDKKLERYEKATSFSGFWTIQTGKTNGTYWQRDVEDWVDLGTEDEYKKSLEKPSEQAA